METLHIAPWAICLKNSCLKKLAVFACDNGFGHARRSILIGRHAALNNFEVSVFAEPRAIKRFSELFGSTENLRFFEFESQTKEHLLENRLYLNNPFDNYKELLSSFDFVISDNHPEILVYRQDAYLSGSFLWHHITEGLSPHYLNTIKELMAKNQTKIFASEIFAMPMLFQELEVIPCGLVKPEKIVYQEKKNLLVSGGKTKAIDAQLRDLLKVMIQESSIKVFDKIFLDTDLFDDSFKDLGFYKADFSAEMYASLAIAIIRPGIGTVTDCIANKVYMLTVDEGGNVEIEYNAQQIRSLGIGESFTERFFSNLQLDSFVKDKSRLFENIRLTGTEDVLQYLNSK